MKNQQLQLTQLLTLAILLMLMAGCTPRMTIDPPPPPDVKAEAEATELWQLAQSYDEQQMYPEAAEAYQRYLTLFPQDARTSLALYRLGYLNLELGDYEAASRHLHEVSRRFPATRHATQALVLQLQVEMAQQHYLQVIQTAGQVLQRSLAASEARAVYMLAGDAHLALNAPEDAMAKYFEALARKPDQTHYRMLLERLQAGLQPMDAAPRRAWLHRMADVRGAETLLYDLARTEIDLHSHAEAVDLLELFIQKQPDHASIPEAHALIEDLRDRSQYHRQTIGCLLPLSGRLSVWGYKALQGIQLALMEQQAASASLTLLIRDTASSAESARQGAKELAAEGVAAIIGPLTNVNEAAQVAQAHGIPMMVLTQQDDALSAGEFIFRNFITPRMQVETLVEHAVTRLGLQRFAILYPQDSYGETYRQFFSEAVTRHQVELVFADAYAPEDVDFSRIVARLARHYETSPASTPETRSGLSPTPISPTPINLEPPKGIEALFIPDGPTKAALIVPQLAFHDVREVQLLGANVWHSHEFFQNTGSYLDGAIFTDGFWAGSDNPAVQHFMNGFQANFGEVPGFIEAVAYDSARLLFQIVQDPEVRFRASIRQALLDPAGYSGVTGRTRWEPHGDVHKQLYLLQFRNNQIEAIDNQTHYPRIHP